MIHIAIGSDNESHGESVNDANSGGDGNSQSSSGKNDIDVYMDEVDEFTPKSPSDMARSPEYALRAMYYNPSTSAVNRSKSEINEDKYKRRALKNSFDLETMPLSAEKTTSELLIRNVSTQTNTASFDDADQIFEGDILKNIPNQFSEEEQQYVVSESVIDCERCGGDGESCDRCSGYGIIFCPNDDCYDGVIKVECTQCNGEGEYTRVIDKELDLTTQTECDLCDDKNRVTQGQCNTCGGTPPIGQTARIECPDCGGDGEAGEECGDCGGVGKLKEQTIKTVEYSLVTTESVSGHQCAQDNSNDVTWVESDVEVIHDSNDLESSPAVSQHPDQDIAKAKITKYDAVLYEGRANINDEDVRVWVSGDENLASTHEYINVKKSGLGSDLIFSGVVGGGLGAAVFFLVNQYPTILPPISGIGPMLSAIPFVLLLIYRIGFKPKYSFHPNESYGD